MLQDTSGILELATDTSVAAEWLDLGSSVNSTVIVNRATSDVGITHSLGTLYLGTGARLNVTKGDNVASGTATLGFSSLIMAGTAIGTATFNPTTAAVSITGSVNSGVNYAKTLVLDGTNANNAISGIISNGSATAGVSLLKSGTSTWSLSNANTYTGNTTITGGTLTLDYTTVGSKIADASVLVLGGGTLNLANGASAHNEVVASTTLNAGASAVTRASGTSVLRMNVITRNVGSTLNFGAASIADTYTNNSSNGILGGWATVGGTDWAKSVDASAADTAITAYTGYTNDTWAAVNNVTVTESTAPTSGSTANSLRFNAAGAYTVTLAGTNTLTTGGILVTSNVANNLSKITGDTLVGASGSDLVVTQNNTSNGLTIESIIANNTSATALTKSGAGLLTLTANNTYTGGTYVNGGTLVLSGTSQTTGAVSVAAGAVLELKSATAFANLVTLSGLGTIRLNGSASFGTAADVISMSAGALIDLRAGSFNGGASSNKVYTNNFASLNVESGASFGTSNVAVRMDALTGLGDINASSSSTGGSFTFGVGNTDGSFGGKLTTTSTNKFNFTKAGTGTQTLTGSTSDYTSTMIVSAGTLAMSGSGKLGASTSGLTLSGGQLDLGTTSQTVGAVSVTGAYGSGDTIRNGNITGASYAASNATGNAIISANLLVNSTAGFVKSGAGSVTLTGVNTYTGGTAVNHGVLYLSHTGDSSPAIKGDVTIAGAGNNATRGVLFLNASNQLESTASVSMSINTATYNSYADFVLGGNSQTISGLTFSGTLGNQNIENAKADAQGIITSNGTLTINNSIDITVPSTVNFRDKESGASTGTLAVVKSGSAAMTIGAGSVANTGGWTLDAGTLKLAGNLGATVPVSLNAGTLSSSSAVARSAAGAVTLGGDVTLGDATNTGKLTFGGAGTLTGNRELTIASDVEFTGAIGQDQAGRALTKSGNGTLTLTAANTYTGATTIKAGTLTLGSAGTIASSNIIVGDTDSSGTILDVSSKTGGFTIGSTQTLSGIGTIDANDGTTKYTVTIEGTHAPGNSPGIQTVDGNLSYADGSIFEWDIDRNETQTRGTTYDGVNVSGTLTGLDGVDEGTTVDAKFRIVIGDSDFSDTFWNTTRSWADIFTEADGTTVKSDWASIFGGGFEYYYNNGTSLTAIEPGTVATQGSFTFTGATNSTLTWTAVPEPTSALAGLLVAAGLLRRRREA